MNNCPSWKLIDVDWIKYLSHREKSSWIVEPHELVISCRNNCKSYENCEEVMWKLYDALCDSKRNRKTIAEEKRKLKDNGSNDDFYNLKG